MRTYVAFYKGEKRTIKAEDLYSAKQYAIRLFNVSRRNESKIEVVQSADANGKPVIQDMLV